MKKKIKERILAGHDQVLLNESQINLYYINEIKYTIEYEKEIHDGYWKWKSWTNRNVSKPPLPTKVFFNLFDNTTLIFTMWTWKISICNWNHHLQLQVARSHIGYPSQKRRTISKSLKLFYLKFSNIFLIVQLMKWSQSATLSKVSCPLEFVILTSSSKLAHYFQSLYTKIWISKSKIKKRQNSTWYESEKSNPVAIFLS